MAAKAHSGQRDKGGRPYLCHPVAVARAMATDEEKTVALLHDVVEDSDITLAKLRALGFPLRVVGAVGALTRREGDSYQSYLWRVKRCALARRVKLADLRHNMDLSRIADPCARDKARVAKYRKALEYLVSSD